MSQEQPLIGLHARGFNGDLPPLDRVEDMATYYNGVIREHQPRGPYLFGGSSLGGVVAFEMARQLHAQGEQVGLVVLFDSGVPPRAISTLRRRAQYHVQVLAALPAEGKVAYLQTKARTAARKLWKRIMVSGSQQEAPKGPRPLREVYDAVSEASFQAFERYAVRPYPGRITFIRASDRPRGERAARDLGWGEWAEGGVDVQEVPGSHLKMFDEPFVRTVAARLQSCIDAARVTA